MRCRQRQASASWIPWRSDAINASHRSQLELYYVRLKMPSRELI